MINDKLVSLFLHNNKYTAPTAIITSTTTKNNCATAATITTQHMYTYAHIHIKQTHNDSVVSYIKIQIHKIAVPNAVVAGGAAVSTGAAVVDG